MSEPFHVHGFRSALTDWAANEGFPDAVVEAALAHKTPDAVQAAYRRTTYLGTSGQPGARVKPCHHQLHQTLPIVVRLPAGEARCRRKAGGRVLSMTAP